MSIITVSRNASLRRRCRQAIRAPGTLRLPSTSTALETTPAHGLQPERMPRAYQAAPSRLTPSFYRRRYPTWRPPVHLFDRRRGLPGSLFVRTMSPPYPIPSHFQHCCWPASSVTYVWSHFSTKLPVPLSLVVHSMQTRLNARHRAPYTKKLGSMLQIRAV